MVCHPIESFRWLCLPNEQLVRGRVDKTVSHRPRSGGGTSPGRKTSQLSNWRRTQNKTKHKVLNLQVNPMMEIDNFAKKKTTMELHVADDVPVPDAAEVLGSNDTNNNQTVDVRASTSRVDDANARNDGDASSSARQGKPGRGSEPILQNSMSRRDIEAEMCWCSNQCWGVKVLESVLMMEKGEGGNSKKWVGDGEVYNSSLGLQISHTISNSAQQMSFSKVRCSVVHVSFLAPSHMPCRTPEWWLLMLQWQI